MTSEEMDEEIGEEAFEPGWRERIWAVGAAAGKLLETRGAILQEELSAKGSLLGRAFVGVFVALLFAWLAGLLLTALLAALLTKLLGGPVLGILATLVLYLAVAGLAGWLVVRKLSGFRPFEFPATRREIDRDLEAVKRAAGIGERRATPEEAGSRAGLPDRASSPEAAEEMEARLREGAG